MPTPLIVGPLLDIAGKVIDRIIPDKAAAQKAKDDLAVQLATEEFQTQLAQIQVNQQEAASTNWFVAGWRPFVGWVCGIGLLYVALIEPIIRFVAMAGFKYHGPFPLIDTSLTMQVLLGMLGLAGIRGYEKSKGVAR